MTTFWISKYALSTGIFVLDTDVEPKSDGYLSCFAREPRYIHHFYNKREWHRTESSAIGRANEMRKTKLASLAKQIDRLKALRFGS